jgi:hypothetical protein
MARSSQKSPDSKSQRERFIETVRELGVDEDPEAFEKAFGKIVPPKKPKGEKGDAK